MLDHVSVAFGVTNPEVALPNIANALQEVFTLKDEVKFKLTLSDPMKTDHVMAFI